MEYLWLEQVQELFNILMVQKVWIRYQVIKEAFTLILLCIYYHQRMCIFLIAILWVYGYMLVRMVIYCKS